MHKTRTGGEQPVRVFVIKDQRVLRLVVCDIPLRHRGDAGYVIVGRQQFAGDGLHAFRFAGMQFGPEQGAQTIGA